MDQRFESIDKRFEAMDQRLDSRFATFERRLVSLNEKLDSIVRRFDDDMKGHWKILNEHEDRLKDLEAAERERTSRH